MVKKIFLYLLFAPFLLGGVTYAAVKQEVSSVVSISEKVKLKAYPNPFKEVLNLVVEAGTSEPTHLKVYDLIGVERAHISLNVTSGNSQKVSLRNMEAGVYFCNVYQQDVLLSSIKVICVR